jgi:peptidoglycan/xylan/chitin deacetylase (PgdA/CDA1 family)
LNLFRVPFFLPWLYPQLTWRIKTSEKTLYLTFDDGPVPGPTEFVLQELQKFSAQATFFCIGDNIRKYPELFRKVVEAGHAVGNHTFNHLSGWNTQNELYLQNIQQCDEQINGTGPESHRQHLFRPPYGRITRSQIRQLSNRKIIMWDVLTHDYARRLPEEKCLKGSLAAVRPGSIIVFHDSLKASRNLMYVLPRMLNHFTELGYSFKPLS